MIKYIFDSRMKDIHLLYESKTSSLRYRNKITNDTVVSFCNRKIFEKKSNIISVFAKIENICKVCIKNALASYSGICDNEKDFYDIKTAFNDCLEYSLSYYHLPNSRFINKFNKKFKKYLKNAEVFKLKKF